MFGWQLHRFILNFSISLQLFEKPVYSKSKWWWNAKEICMKRLARKANLALVYDISALHIKRLIGNTLRRTIKQIPVRGVRGKYEPIPRVTNDKALEDPLTRKSLEKYNQLMVLLSKQKLLFVPPDSASCSLKNPSNLKGAGNQSEREGKKK